jgi:lipid-A-disaccharide synthase-like uncharacterized protein
MLRHLGGLECAKEHPWVSATVLGIVIAGWVAIDRGLVRGALLYLLTLPGSALLLGWISYVCAPQPLRRRVFILRFWFLAIAGGMAALAYGLRSATAWNCDGIAVALYVTSFVWLSDPRERWFWGEAGERARKLARITVPIISGIIGVLIFLSHPVAP